MKGWAVITVGLYVAVAVLLTVPVFWAYFAGQALVAGSGEPVAQTFAMFREWSYWGWIGVSVVSQILLLAVPVAVSERRPRKRRHILVPVLTAAFLLGFVCVSVVASLESGIWGDNSSKFYNLRGDTGIAQVQTMLLYLVIVWIVWALVFRRFAVNDDPDAMIRRLMRWLLRGSILELLIAVPCHVATRHRHDCCAPAISFWGIVTGITVMLLSFGPGVFFLFAARMRQLKGQ